MGLSDLVKKATGGVQTPEKPRSGSISSRTTPGGNGDQDSVDKGAEGDDVSVLDEKEGNVILAMISQRELSSALPTSFDGACAIRRRATLGRTSSRALPLISPSSDSAGH